MALPHATAPAKLYVLIDFSGCARRDHGCRWHVFEEKRQAVMAIEAAVGGFYSNVPAHHAFSDLNKGIESQGRERADDRRRNADVCANGPADSGHDCCLRELILFA
jgi:hypothetical protein